jgi:type IV pilus assembly protein PilF
MVVLLLSGCAHQQTATLVNVPQQPATPGEADAKTRADIHTQLGAAYFEIGNFGVALEELNEALKADPNYVTAHNVMGLVYMELREDAAAVQSFERALRINPLDSDTNNNYGWFLCQRKRYDEGIRYILAALKNPLYQTPEKSLVNAGVCARERGDEAGAVQYFERALSTQPLQPQALYQLADISFKRGQLGIAKDLMTRMIKAGFTLNAESLWLGLRISRGLGDNEAEASYGLQLRRNFPNARETQALLNRQFE